MRHLTIADYGQFVGLSGERLVVSKDGVQLVETPLSRLRSITIAKEGVGFSSNIVLACALRGIRLFILDWRGQAVAALAGQHRHAIAAFRRQQFAYIESDFSRITAAGMIYGKLRNQRAVLLYFAKYPSAYASILKASAAALDDYSRRLRETDWLVRDHWRAEIMGIEGAAASMYWQALAEAQLLGVNFQARMGRGADELANQLLNYGYTLLTSYVWAALDNAGFEIYAGVLHSDRPGKPALVLDMMEEYRAWVVDRNVIKMRQKLKQDQQLTAALKKQLSSAIHQTFAARYAYRGKRLKLETILQRQAYRLAGCMVENHRYQAYRFKW